MGSSFVPLNSVSFWIESAKAAVLHGPGKIQIEDTAPPRRPVAS